jgi:hypothetical protein
VANDAVDAVVERIHTTRRVCGDDQLSLCIGADGTMVTVGEEARLGYPQHIVQQAPVATPYY